MVFSIIALLGVGVATAFPFGFNKGPMAQELSEEDQAEMLEFQDSLQTAIEEGDYETWKSLMESQLTEENFNRVVEMHQKMEENREARQKRGVEFCEDEDCPTLEGMEFKHQMHRGFRNMPEITEDSE